MKPIEPEELYQVGRAGQMAVKDGELFYSLQDLLDDIIARLEKLEGNWKRIANMAGKLSIPDAAAFVEDDNVVSEGMQKAKEEKAKTDVKQ